MTALLALAALVVPRAAQAQIVNVQSLVDGDEQPGLSGALEGSVDWRTGNTRLIVVRGSGLARWRAGDHLVFGIVRGEHGESGPGRDTFVSKTFEHLRYRYRVIPRLEAEAFAQHETDEFRRLRVRALVGAGPRVAAVARKEWTVHVGVAAMLEHEQYADDAAGEPQDSQTVGRLSSYVVGRADLDTRLKVSGALYVQPRIDAFRDVRTLGELALAVALFERVSLTQALVVAHDSRPPADVARTDTSLQSALVVRF